MCLLEATARITYHCIGINRTELFVIKHRNFCSYNITNNDQRLCTTNMSYYHGTKSSLRGYTKNYVKSPLTSRLTKPNLMLNTKCENYYLGNECNKYAYIIFTDIKISCKFTSCRSQWPRGLKRGSPATRLLGSPVRIALGDMDVCLLCIKFSATG